MDLWVFVMVALALASGWRFRAADGDVGDPVFLSRAQANEWKGWMQVAFVAYHYANAQDVYVPIRWAVSAYVWLTGFGNGVYFWSSADFSVRRFAQQLWRMNFLACLLALATNTAWIDYYFVALATVHFVLLFCALGAARLAGSRLFGWAPPDRKAGREAVDAEKALGFGIAVALAVALWVPPLLIGGRRSGAPKTPYDYAFQTWLEKVNAHTADYFWSRTRMDYLSSLHGLAFAAVYARFRDRWPGWGARAKAPLYAAAAGLFSAAVWVATTRGGDPKNYQAVNAYVGTLWVPLYLLARNATPDLARRVAAPMEWIGMHSLEFYLLQFHVLLTRKSQLILYIIPKEKWGYTNMALVTGCYVVFVIKALQLTNAARAVAWRAAKTHVAAVAIWVVAAYATFEAYYGNAANPCSAESWAVFAVFAAAATAAALAAVHRGLG